MNQGSNDPEINDIYDNSQGNSYNHSSQSGLNISARCIPAIRSQDEQIDNLMKDEPVEDYQLSENSENGCGLQKQEINFDNLLQDPQNQQSCFENVNEDQLFIQGELPLNTDLTCGKIYPQPVENILAVEQRLSSFFLKGNTNQEGRNSLEHVSQPNQESMMFANDNELMEESIMESERHQEMMPFSFQPDENHSEEYSVNKIFTPQNEPEEEVNKYGTTVVPPKKPLSPYIFFSQEKRKELKLQHPEWNSSQIMKQVSVIWAKMPQEERHIFQEVSTKDKNRYEAEREEYLRIRDLSEFKNINQKESLLQQHQNQSVLEAVKDRSKICQLNRDQHKLHEQLTSNHQEHQNSHVKGKLKPNHRVANQGSQEKDAKKNMVAKNDEKLIKKRQHQQHQFEQIQDQLNPFLLAKRLKSDQECSQENQQFPHIQHQHISQMKLNQQRSNQNNGDNYFGGQTIYQPQQQSIQQQESFSEIFNQEMAAAMRHPSQ